MEKILKWLYKKMTGNYESVYLFGVTINLRKAMKEGAEGNRVLHVHNSLAKDPYITASLEHIVDYINEHYSLVDLLPPE